MAAAAAAAPLAGTGWGWRSVAGFLGGAVLIDADHYLDFVLETGDWSLRRAYAYHRRRYRQPRRWRFRPRRPALGFERGRLFHAAPLILGLLVLGWRWPALRPLAYGALFHRLQDDAWAQFV